MPAPPGAPVRALARRVARERARYLAGVGCLLAATGLGLLVPHTVQRAIEALEAGAPAAAVTPYAALVVALALAAGVARLSSRLAIMGAAQRIEAALRADLHASLLREPPAFYLAHQTGDLMTRASSDAAAVRVLVGFGTVSFVSTVFAFVGAVAAMAALDPWLTLWALAPTPVLVALARRANVLVHERTLAAQEQLGALAARVQETLAGAAVVRAYTMERAAAARFDADNAACLGRALALARVLAAFAPLTGLAAGLGALIVLWLGGRAVMEGRLTLGALVAFHGYLAYLAWPTMALGFTLSVVRRGLTSLARIEEVVRAAPPPAAGEPPPPAPLGVRFARLTFAHAGRGPVLRDVSFEVRPGETVAVVGPTGSGKSTLGALLTRLWEPPPGTVFLGDRDVTRLDLAALRRAVGYVPQEAFLFSRALADNIALDRAGVDAAAVRAAAATAGVADEIARLPEGWATVVGERGVTLSGGQRQRVALARALAGQPPVLVLDDVFAAVDAAKEEEIVQALRRALAGRTVLLMTHRLRPARAADRIVVLVDGRVVETGAHEALLAAGGVYARLWRLEQLEEEIARA